MKNESDPLNSINVSDLAEGLTKVGWSIDMNKLNGKISNTFQLNRPIFSCNEKHIFNVSFAYDYIGAHSCERINESPVFLCRKNRPTLYPFRIKLSLKEIPQTALNDFGDSRNGVTSDYHYNTPVAIWTEIYGLNNTVLKENLFGSQKGIKRWVTETCWVDVRISGLGWKPITLTCYLWIKFKPLSIGEINSLILMTNMFHKQINCDVLFLIQNDTKSEVEYDVNREQKIGGHTYILADRSPVFAALFKYDMKKEGDINHVLIKHTKPDTFKEMLSYIYSGRLVKPIDNEESARLLYEVADMYDINDLKDHCIHFLLPQITFDNAIYSLVWGHLYSSKKVMESALRIIASRGTKRFEHEDWVSLRTEYPALFKLAFCPSSL